jgi:tetratricopeptide (TPR) repeat protein
MNLPLRLASLNNMAVTSAKKNRYDEAIDLLKRAIALRPDQYMAHYNLGCIFQVKKNFDLAIEAFKETLRLKPEFADAYYHLGVSYNETKRYADAIEALTARFD